MKKSFTKIPSDILEEMNALFRAAVKHPENLKITAHPNYKKFNNLLLKLYQKNKRRGELLASLLNTKSLNKVLGIKI